MARIVGSFRNRHLQKALNFHQGVLVYRCESIRMYN